MNFRNRVLLIVSTACLLCTLVAVIVSGECLYEHGKDEVVQKSVAILSNLEQVRKYVATQGGLAETINEAVKKYPDGNLSKEEKLNVLKRVPIFAAMRIGKPNEGAEYEFRIFAEDPRNKDNTPTAEELQILKKFEADSNLKEWMEEKNDKVFVYRPVRLDESQGCLKCHGDPQHSPYQNGKDVLGFPMENWKDGKLHGVFAVVSSLAPVKAATVQSSVKILACAAFVTFLLIGLAVLFLQKPLRKLNEMSDSLQKSGQSLAVAAESISSSSHSLSSSAAEAAASLEETSASTEEISGMIRKNADYAIEASQLSKEAQNKALSGKAKFQELLKCMNDISQSSTKIEEIISVIDDIAFQTNLLALNAAVEAARAGDQGKGFSVVAEAVRALAGRSADSAKQIAGLIQSSVEQARHGSVATKSSEDSLNEILFAIEKIARINDEISTASSEQAKGIEGVNQAINQLDKVTQQNASASEETSASSEQLSQQSRDLHSLVLELSGILKGKGEPSQSSS